jgi:hypothetical protein
MQTSQPQRGWLVFDGYFPAISLATWTPLAEAWDREWVMPLPSPMM